MVYLQPRTSYNLFVSNSITNNMDLSYKGVIGYFNYY